MNCQRCNGLLVRDTYVSCKWTDPDGAYFYRCLNCGNAEDELIVQHRLRRPEPRKFIHDLIATGKSGDYRSVKEVE